jgi:hypothetical protein
MPGHDSSLVANGNPQTRARFHAVAAVGAFSIAFSILCLYFVPIFGGLFGISMLAGLGCVALALPFKANRMAIVVGVFSITPIFRFIFFDKAGHHVTLYVPLGVASVIAIGAFIDYLRARPALANPTA